MSRFIPRGVAVAGIGKRFVAALVDGIVPALIGGGLFLVTQFSSSATVLLVGSIAAFFLLGCYSLYQWWAYGSRGAGIGARVMGLRVVGMTDGDPIGWWRFFLRSLVYAALMATVVGGLALIVFLVIHERRQGWHDLAVKAVVVEPKEKEVKAPRVAAQKRAGSTGTVGLPPHLSSSFAPGGSDTGTSTGYGGYAPGGTPTQPPAWMPHLETEPIISTQHQHQPPGMGPQWPTGPVQQPAQPPVQQQTPVQQQWQQGPPQQSHQPPAQQPWQSQPQQVPQQQAPAAQSAPQQPQAPVPSQATPPVPVNQGWIPLPTPTSVIEPSQKSANSPRVRERAFGDVEDDDDGTRISKPLGDSGRPGDEGWYIRLDDGREVDLTVTVLLGRNPQRTQGDPEVHLVPAGGDGRMISRTHVLIATDPRGVYVVDRGSTNGTAVVTASGDLEPCPVGTQVRAKDGQQVSYGNRWFTVLRRPMAN